MDIRGHKVGTAHPADEGVDLADCDEYQPRGRRLRTLSEPAVRFVIGKSRSRENCTWGHHRTNFH